MTSRTFAWTASAAVLALGLAACGGSDDTDTDAGSTGGSTTGSANLSGDLNGAGSSAQTAAMQAWAANFQDANPQATVNYDPVGSGGGREQFIAGGIDFAGSDSALSDDEITQADTRCGGAGKTVEVPVYISPIAVIYNLDGVDNLQLSPDTLAQIFDQKITTWNDPAIAEDNPDADLPDTAISPVNRSDKSGTTTNFTQFLAGAVPDSWPHDASDTWPVQGGEAANGTSGVVAAVKGGAGTIGYADASQAGELGIAAIKIGDDYVAPSAEGAAAAVDEATQVEGRGDADLAYTIKRDSTTAGVYPIVLLSYQIACAQYDDAAKASLVKAFLTYVVSADGQAAAASNAGSAPISDTLREAATTAINTIGT